MGRKSDKIEERPRSTYKREVPEKLTTEAAIALADAATRKRARADELEDELKEHTTRVKAEVKELRGAADRDHAASEKRVRMVVAEVYEEVRGSQVYVLSVGSGEVVDQRAATLAERQQDFPGLDTGGPLPTPSSGGDGADDQADGGGDPVIVTPPGGAPRHEDDELETDAIATNGPRSAAEERTRAPRKRGGASGGKGKAGKGKGKS